MEKFQIVGGARCVVNKINHAISILKKSKYGGSIYHPRSGLHIFKIDVNVIYKNTYVWDWLETSGTDRYVGSWKLLNIRKIQTEE